MKTQILTLAELLNGSSPLPASEWNLKAVLSHECLTYFAWNTKSREALVIDPKHEKQDTYQTILKELRSYKWLGVFDTHTHADHISSADLIAKELTTSYFMHEKASCSRVTVRINENGVPPISQQSESSPLRFIVTPGHTPDSIVVTWGPFAFTGDTVLFNDVGRDDLPGGSALAHFESLERLKTHLNESIIILPGHDNRGGRASTWAQQLSSNPSLTQTREDFIHEANAFKAPPPKHLEESLLENCK